MMDMQALLADFLNDLEAISDDELLSELETAKRDSIMVPWNRTTNDNLMVNMV